MHRARRDFCGTGHSLQSHTLHTERILLHYRWRLQHHDAGELFRHVDQWGNVQPQSMPGADRIVLRDQRKLHSYESAELLGHMDQRGNLQSQSMPAADRFVLRVQRHLYGHKSTKLFRHLDQWWDVLSEQLSAAAGLLLYEWRLQQFDSRHLLCPGRIAAGIGHELCDVLLSAAVTGLLLPQWKL